jgi:hypothetical protein
MILVVRFEAVTAVKTAMVVFGVVAQCGLVGGDQCFDRSLLP